MFALDLLAENKFGDTRSGSMAGPMGLLVIVLLAIVTVLLIRNMSARIRRLPDRFPGQDEPEADHDEPTEDPSPQGGSSTPARTGEGQPDRPRPAG